MKNKTRFTYTIIFVLLLLAEILIGTFVNDSFIRPYVGDVLVVMLICAFLRIFIPEKPKLLPLYTTLFAVAVEVLQYFDFVRLLSLEGNRILSVALGRTFDVRDIICYIAGGIIFFSAERFFVAKQTRRKVNDR